MISHRKDGKTVLPLDRELEDVRLVSFSAYLASPDAEYHDRTQDWTKRNAKLQ